ncbi:MAG: glycosyltransferase [Calditrichaeota bacterium]|nr:MAG: glycosyltransferase [Calditrichota bacterium]MBL1205129.1 glycosyltransferase [Calditrichota bacterium]NOG44959.1 glycosyltransferase [Calditrichota bacterium]
MNSQTNPKFSIIVPTFNRVEELKELLASFGQLNFPANQFEIVVSDDGSTDETEELLQSYIKKNEFNLVYLRQENKGPGAARNHGMEKANGEFFIFVDSDVTMPADWLENISITLDAEKADAFGGPDTFRDDFPPLLKAINYSMTSFITTGGLRGKKGKKLAKFYPRSFNMGLSRKLWQKIGGFGSLRHGQDIEFSHRIIQSGAKVVFVEDAPVYHKRRTNLRRFYKQVFNWGVARINLYKLDKGMLEVLHAAPAFATLFVFLFLILPFIFNGLMSLFTWGIILGFFVLLFSMIDSVRLYKSLKPALWLPFVMPAQIFGYGLGFIYNFVRRVILSKEEKTGFKKNYYK